MANNLNILPPLDSWINVKTGQPTPEFYRFVISLLDLSGGSSTIIINELGPLTISAPTASPSDVQTAITGLQGLSALSAATPQVSTADYQQLKSQVQGQAAQGAATARLSPADSQQLQAEVVALRAMIALMQRAQGPALSDRIEKLEALVYGGLAWPLH